MSPPFDKVVHVQNKVLPSFNERHRAFGRRRDCDWFKRDAVFQVLLGLLTGSEKQFTTRSSSVNAQEPYNILPLASSQIRSEVNSSSSGTSEGSTFLRLYLELMHVHELEKHVNRRKSENTTLC